VAIRGAFVVDEIPSERWDLALELITTGGPLVVVERELALGIKRYIGWPSADGLIHVSAFTSTEPSVLSAAAVERDGRAAVVLLADVVERDARFRQLLDEIGYELA
jgi:hypothetical protein